MVAGPAEPTADRPAGLPPATGLRAVSGSNVLAVRTADVGVRREQRRRRRLWTIAGCAAVPSAFLWYRVLDHRPFDVFAFPHIDWLTVTPILFFVALAAVLGGSQLLTGRSPHELFRPDQIDVRLRDVVGVDMVKEEVVRSLNLFLAHETFAREMGGRARRGLLFEGAPGTGKTHLAKAMAAEAGVPFLFASATSFQSSFYGATARKIRSYFRALRRVAEREGGAIAFIDEFDAIAVRRMGMEATPSPLAQPAGALAGCSATADLPGRWSQPAAAGPGGSVQFAANPGLVGHPLAGTSDLAGPVVNELLVQLQSFDTPRGPVRLVARAVDGLNLLLPLGRQLPKPHPRPANVLVIAATNRADKLDPALMRPGRFDRRLTFELPDKAGRRALVDYFLRSKAHAPDLDRGDRRDALAAITRGYSPAMIEHLFDEALVNAVRRGDAAMNWLDLERARLTEEVGQGQPVRYTEHERRLIATHEAGHATAAYLLAPRRRLEVLTIVKRRQALGLLAHADPDEVFTHSRSEMLALIQISLAGQCAEELFFGDVSTGPGGDLLYATNVAAEMIGTTGMSGTLVSYAAVQNSAFHDTNIVGRVLADPEGRQRVEALLQEQKAVVYAWLQANGHLLTALRDALLDRAELVGAEITDVLHSAGPVRRVGARPQPVVDLRDQQVARPS